MDNMENGDVIIRSENIRVTLPKWWDGRSKNQKKYIYCVLGLTAAILILILIYFLVIYDKPTICTTPKCKATAQEILSYIDETQSPCDDFYKFACGGFLKNFTFDDQYGMQSVKYMMEEMIQSDIKNMLEEPIDPEDLPSFNLAKKFYRACTNEQEIAEQGVKKLQSIFKLMGGWPILEGENWRSEKFDWVKVVRNLRAFGVNTDFFFNVTVDIDRKNPGRYILGIHDTFFGVSDISPNSKVAYLDYMVDVASQFKVKSNNLWQEQNRVLDFLFKLAKISEDSKKSNQTNMYNPYTLSELLHEFNTINWYIYLQGVLGNTVELSYDEIISVSEPIYLKQLEKLLRSTDKRVLANFIGWHIVENLINYLPSNILDKAYEYLRKMNGEFSRKPRWNVCVEATRQRLSPAINLAYVERYFNENIRANVTNLIRNVKTQFKKNLLILDWLDEETKRKLTKTLLSSVEKIFSDQDLIDIIEESSIYDDVEINEDKFLEAVLNLDVILWDQHYSLLRKPVRDEWIKTQTFITGLKVIYSATENTLKFPLGLFRGIYYDNTRPDYMNYGLLGSVIAHQISHIFVEMETIHTGESHAVEEKLINWWSPNSKNKYVEKLECLSNQYAKFRLGETDDIQTNSLITRDEDIADLAGFKVAYDSYLEKEWRNGPESLLPGLKYSSRQLFWISSSLQFCSKFPVGYLRDKYSGIGYQHSPNEFRVNGPLQNLNEFAYDFGCNSGSYMNPVKKCYIW